MTWSLKFISSFMCVSRNRQQNEVCQRLGESSDIQELNHMRGFHLRALSVQLVRSIFSGVE